MSTADSCRTVCFSSRGPRATTGCSSWGSSSTICWRRPPMGRRLQRRTVPHHAESLQRLPLPRRGGIGGHPHRCRAGRSRPDRVDSGLHRRTQRVRRSAGSLRPQQDRLPPDLHRDAGLRRQEGPLPDTGLRARVRVHVAGQRVAFFDTMDDFGFFTEVAEEKASFHVNLSRISQTCAEWDGSDPIRTHRDGYRTP